MRHAYSRSYNLVPIGLSLSWTSTSMSLTYKECLKGNKECMNKNNGTAQSAGSRCRMVVEQVRCRRRRTGKPR
ncbi:MAG: hypothetical protein OJF51_002489 [Nitrospira sp.]|nr:MAG: hypothetical protein OJF51_002489 [Nitrospira sp.]